jgi:hypothetical protein
VEREALAEVPEDDSRAVRYVPVLKAKDAEYRALKAVPPATAEHVAPLLEVPSIPWDYEADEPAKSIDQHVQPVVGRISDAWGGRRAYLDFALVADERMADGRHPLAATFEQAAAVGLQLIPVLSSGASPEYAQAVAAATARDGRGVCLRLGGDDLAGPDPAATVDGLLADVGGTAAETDLVLDLAAIPDNQANVLVAAWATILRALPRRDEWRTVTIAATAFPQSLSGLPADAITLLPRTEWEVYQGLVAAALPRLPDFGDYAIAHPEPVEMDPRLMRISAQIRYTSDSKWLVVRGRNTREHGWGQTQALSAELMARAEFSRDHCPTDTFIVRRAAGQEGPGQATTWRRLGTLHHLVLVVEQLSSSVSP